MKLYTIGDINPHCSRFDPDLAKRLNKLAMKESAGEEGALQDPEPTRQSGAFPFTVEDLVNHGNDDFYDESKNIKGSNGQLLYAGISENAYVGVPVSLEKCLKWARENNGIVAAMPYLIAGLSIAKPDNYLRQRWHTAFSEEHVGIDTEGIYRKGKPIVVVQHGIELLLPDRIRKAYNERLTAQNGAKLSPDEWKKVLQASTPLYTVQDVREGKVKNPFGNYRVVLDFEKAKATRSGYQNKNAFMNNDLVLARAGTLDYLNNYFENIKHSDGTVGNWHMFNEIDPRVAQGRVLFYGSGGGLGGFDLGSGARFVGVRKNA